ncbi:MAG: hypothetical protein LBS70_09925 [Candidatus Accumulibacter sp.]|nr:hypothetical protein [Accumulibacter sp.]
MEASLSFRGWAIDLLNAAEIPDNLSTGYAGDLRHLFLRRWESELDKAGIPILPNHPDRLDRSKARLIECEPFSDPYGNMHDAHFCFGYGAADVTFGALNYRNPYLKTRNPRYFLDKHNPLLLGNFAVGVERNSEALTWIYPPPDIVVTGIANVQTAKRSYVFMWLGVRYRREEAGDWLLDALENIVLQDQIIPQKTLTYHYGSVFSRQFAGARYNLTPKEENEMRARMGYPPRGKPTRERILYDSVCAIFGEANVVRHYRGRELEGLEIDIWVPVKHLGIEYQGQQHFRHIEHWHGADGLAKQKERDARKRRLCKRLGIALVYFDPDDALDRASIIAVLRRQRVL